MPVWHTAEAVSYTHLDTIIGDEVNIVTIDQIIKNIAQLEYSLFVVNSYAAGIQQYLSLIHI